MAGEGMAGWLLTQTYLSGLLGKKTSTLSAGMLIMEDFKLDAGQLRLKSKINYIN
jgi:hypothetical protein